MDFVSNLLLIMPNLIEESIFFHIFMGFLSVNSNELTPYYQISLKHDFSKDI